MWSGMWSGPTSTSIRTDGTKLSASEVQRLQELKDSRHMTSEERVELSCLLVRKRGMVFEWRHWHSLPKPSGTHEELQRFIQDSKPTRPDCLPKKTA